MPISLFGQACHLVIMKAQEAAGSISLRDIGFSPFDKVILG